MNRASFVLVASVAFACLTACEPEEEPGMAVEDLCTAVVEVVCAADAECCTTHPPDCVEAQSRECLESIQPLLDDPRLAYDPVRGGAFVEALRARAETCWQEPVDYDALIDAFDGTGAEGADCTPPAFDASELRTSALSCARGLACRIHLDASGRAEGVCEARSDEACSHALDCGPGRFCDVPSNWTPGLWGTCRPLRADGWACANDLECESRHCDGTCGVPVLSARCLATDYESLVLEAGPTAYLRFEESSGVRASDLAGQRHGTLSDAVMHSGETPIGSAIAMEEEPDDAGVADAGTPDAGAPPPPSEGGSIRFASDDAVVRVASIAELAGAPGTSFEVWVRLDGAEATGPILELSDGAEPGPHVWVFDRGDELYANLVGEEGTAQLIETPEGTLSAGEWHHVLVTHDGETARLYLDGRRVGEVAAPNALRTDGDLFIGHRPSGEAPVSLRGAIDEVAIYARALDEAEVRRHHEAGLAGAHSPRFSLFRWLRP